MNHSPLHTRCANACALITQEAGRWIIQPEAPESMAGSNWFTCLAGLDATTEPVDCTVRWLPLRATNVGDYTGNDNFASVLDRVCFLDHGDGTWQRLTEVQVAGDEAHLQLPPGPAGRRFAIGMPVDARDLHGLLSEAQASPHAQVRLLGHATRGSPVWGLTVSDGDQAQGTIVVQSLQHAQEWAGLRAHRHLLRYLLSPEGAALRQRWRWLCYPATNADGLYRGWRGDPMVVDDYNPNRDWGTFSLPEIRAVADDILSNLQQGPPLAHAVDLHMGWNWRSNPGSAVGVAADDGDLELCKQWHYAFADALMEQSQFSDFHWQIHRRGRPTFPSWLMSETGLHGQTLEISRHLWPDAQGGKELPTQQREERFGRDLAITLDAFLSHNPYPR